MDREYLEDYQQRENEEYRRFIGKIRDGTFSIRDDRYPTDERFVKIKKPVAMAGLESIWFQIPFSGSLILPISPIPQDRFESRSFTVREIPSVVDFIKETGKLQIGLTADPIQYVGLDYLQLLFEELHPPQLSSFHIDFLGTQKEIDKASDTFYTLAEPRFNDFLSEAVKHDGSRTIQNVFHTILGAFIALKLWHYATIEEIENLIIDDPLEAFYTLVVCANLIVSPLNDFRSDVRNLSIDEIKSFQSVPLVHHPTEIRFPCEIGKFLMKDKLTHAPCSLEACKDVIYHYDAYDLQKVQASLNEAIVTNHPDIVTKNAEELSEILDNAWNDKTIPNRIKNVEIGVPVSIAAIGGIVAGLPGAFAGGFLSELGFKVVEKATEKYAEKLFNVKGEGLTERLAKLRTKSYQANIYDFKKKYNK